MSGKLLKNDKYFIPPEDTSENFKELFARLTAEGAGRPLDKDGYPDGPWTPETLATAIAGIQANTGGIDVRTVQVWFQDNDNGIANDNIRWLARIFGCDDPVAAAKWQKQLIASRDRLSAERRAKRRTTAFQDAPRSSETGDQIAPVNPIRQRHPSILAVGTSTMLTGANNIYVIILVWASWSILGMSAIVFGLADVTYMTEGKVEKQVGIFSSPAWTLEKLVLIPTYLIVTSKGVIAWCNHRCAFENQTGTETWETRVSAFSPAFYLVLAVSVFVIFGLQWYGTYLQPLLDGPNTDIEPNWIRVATNPIELMPPGLIIGISLYAGLYIGAVYWLCFSSLLLLYIAAHDLTRTGNEAKAAERTLYEVERHEVARVLITALYRSIICGALINTIIKVDALYFVSDAENFLAWIKHDIFAAFGFDSRGWNWLSDGQLASFTTIIFLLTITSVAYFGIYRIKLSIEAAEKRQLVSHAALITAPTFMIVSFGTLGMFRGFSLVFLASLVVGIWQLLSPSLRFSTRTERIS
ncbi:hypothetical protein [uncultured Tateyamaria sp.]|uniref:hypothetical protein n=1 Tax=uncultured Tateyamaria sp. TaxID=455651 RepID=UPI00262CCF8A|nr:hypothetical protein [uncultured Tateyamaria sp.]